MTVLRRLVQSVQLLTVGVALACAVLLFTNQPPPPPEVPVAAPGSTVDVLVLGESIYTSQCESCHGTWGQGVYAPVTIDKVASLEHFPDPALQADVVRTGRGQMPAFADRLTPEQVDAVITYVRQLE